MKIINAIWEKRNLGLNCNEIEIEYVDTVQTIKERFTDFETEYTVIKVPIGMVEISNFIQSSGYTFIELMTLCHNKGILPQLSPIHKRVINSIKCVRMSDKDKKKLFEEINSGMFIYDRVSLDSKFTNHQANNRYLGWVSDELKLGSIFFKLEYKNQAAGFFSLKADGNDLFSSSLGGLYPSFEGVGCGFCLPYFTISEGIKKNAKKISGAFSSNNRGAFLVHLTFGYNNIDKQYYVFTKHN